MEYFIREKQLFDMAVELGRLVRRKTPMQFGFANNDPWYQLPREKTLGGDLVRAD